jgi:hypothetical protein
VSAPVRSTTTSGASVQQVFDLLTSPGWVQTKAERFGDGAELREHEVRDDGSVHLQVSRRLPEGVPGPLQRFLPSDGRVTETFDWAAPSGEGRTGTWRADIAGAPARLGGTMRLEPHGDGSEYELVGEVKVSVPIVGGKAERFIADMVELLAQKETELLLSELGQR